MTVEAALLGRPTISCFPGDKPLYIKYLEKQGLVQTILSPRRIGQTTARSLVSEEEREKQQRRGVELLRRMEDPITVISRIVRKTWKTGDS